MSNYPRSKSLPRRLLGQLREYWKPIPDGVALPTSTSYKYDERLQAWVRGWPVGVAQKSSLQVPDSIVQRTTSKGYKYYELKVPPLSPTDGVYTMGEDCHEQPLSADLGRLVLHDLTSDELMDEWVADLVEEKVDLCSDSTHQLSSPSPTASTLGNDLSLLLPSTLADDNVIAARTDAPTVASSTIAGRLSLWVPAATTRDSSSTVVRHTGFRREYRALDGDVHLVNNDRRGSLWELEDTQMQHFEDIPKSGIGNDNHGAGSRRLTWQPRPQSPKSSSLVPLDKHHNSVVNHEGIGHTFYNSGDSNPGTPAPRTRIQVLVSQRRSWFSAIAVLGCGQSQTSVFHNEIHRPQILAEARDFFMTEIEGGTSSVASATRSALLYAKTPECVFCGLGVESAGPVSRIPNAIDDEIPRSSASTSTTCTSDQLGPDAECLIPSTYRPTGPFSSEVDLTNMKRAHVQRKQPRHAQSEELLGRASPNAWNQTKPLPKAPSNASTKTPNISTLNRSTSLLRSKRTQHLKYAQGPTPPPAKSLPALPSSAEHPGLRAERALVGVPPQPGTHDQVKIKRKPLVSELPPTPTLRKAQPQEVADLRSRGAQQMLRPSGDSGRIG
ncbi:hypothetical protein LTR81_027762 [Elasticomyces elasticus]